MKDTKERFTPGPWSIWGDWKIEDYAGRHVGSFEHCEFKSTKENYANGCLMAAAPELYEKLKAIMLDNLHTHGSDFNDIAGLLAKARGEN